MVYPMTRVTWHDAYTSGSDWDHPEDHESQPAVIVSVGFWLHDYQLDHHITLAQSVAADGQCGELLHVPEPMVQEITGLHPEPPEVRTSGVISKLLRSLYYKL